MDGSTIDMITVNILSGLIGLAANGMSHKCNMVETATNIIDEYGLYYEVIIGMDTGIEPSSSYLSSFYSSSPPTYEATMDIFLTTFLMDYRSPWT